MKIALVVHDHDPGYGQGRYTVELARRLSPDHEVHVYANRFAAPWQPNVTFQRVRALRVSALATIFTFLRSSETLLSRRRYDVVHSQGVSCWRANVITAHICNATRRSVAQENNLKARIFTTLTSKLEQRFYRTNSNAAVIGVSRIVSREVQGAYRLPATPATIHHGIDTDVFRPAENTSECVMLRSRFGLPDDTWGWLFVGEAAKGLAQVIQQLAAFPKATLLVISRSPLDAYERLARTLGVAGRVRFHGPELDVHLAYRASDVFVYPSDYDAFGMVVAEAMASGLAVIAGKTIGAAEWIEDGQNGLLCDVADDKSLRVCLGKLSQEQALGKQLGAAGRATAMKHTWDDCARLTLAVYQQAILKSGGGR